MSYVSISLRRAAHGAEHDLASRSRRPQSAGAPRDAVVSDTAACLVCRAARVLPPPLRIVQRLITALLRWQTDHKGYATEAGSVTLIRHFGSAANPNIDLHCAVLDGVDRSTGNKVCVYPMIARHRPESLASTILTDVLPHGSHSLNL